LARKQTLFDLPLVLLDLETTGGSGSEDRIIEVGLIEVEGGKVVDRWQTLVNPGRRISPGIQGFTGIDDDLVRLAPTFASIAPSLLERLQGKVLVAHNARFDYGFLKNEFARAGRTYRSRVLCTVKLSRALFPEHSRHDLDSLIDRYGLACSARHRAMGDAEAMWDFVQRLRSLADADALESAVRAQLAAPSLPPGLAHGALDAVPESPGVYVFYGMNDLPLYVGKSVDLRSRVWSHFSADHRTARNMSIAQQVTRVDWTDTAGELGALLREARLIKELLPLHNRRERRHAELYSLAWKGPLNTDRPVAITPVDHEEPDRLEHLLGVFRTRHAAREALRALAAELSLCPTLLGLERRTAGSACFSHQLSRCAGACCGRETLPAHNLRLHGALQSLRLPRWRWPGAIGLAEETAERAEMHVFDRWCYLGTARTDPEVFELLEDRGRAAFDMDIYKLLSRTLTRPRRGIRLVELSAPRRRRPRQAELLTEY
jgi:DNA polymerase-3 subunit epsilon